MASFALSTLIETVNSEDCFWLVDKLGVGWLDPLDDDGRGWGVKNCVVEAWLDGESNTLNEGKLTKSNRGGGFNPLDDDRDGF